MMQNNTRSPIKIKPKRHYATVKSAKKLNEKYLEITLTQFSPDDFNFTAGQFINILVTENTYRSYSICSDQNDADRVAIVASVSHLGLGAQYLKNLKVGDTVEFIGPSGRLGLSTDRPEKMFFYSTGTGICPFLSMLKVLRDEGYGGEINLLHGLRKESEIFYLKLLEELRDSLKNFSYGIYISQPETKPDDNSRAGRILADIEVDGNATYYVCGNPDMVRNVKQILTEKGINKDNVISEEFYSPGVRLQTISTA